MKRTQTKFKVDLIITGDWHLMEPDRNPPCRLDKIWEAQWDKVRQIKALGIKHECPIFNSGDIFEHWKTSPALLNRTIQEIPFLYTVIGNHDMPQHNIELFNKSGLKTLEEADTVFILEGNHWRQSKAHYEEIAGKIVNMVHIMTWQGKLPWPDCEDPEAKKMFKTFPKADLIITGHNHKTFTARKGNRLLINPGSLTRHKADQIDHKPCVFLWNAETNDYKIHYLKIKKNIISRSHIEVTKKKEQRLEAFIQKLKDGWDLSLSFEDNMERAFKENKTPDKIKQLIYEWMGV
jgi:DNA repair exonuclease SbcCD nuclease subunit